MKTLVSHEADLGGQGGRANFELGVEARDLVARIEAKYPIEKIVEPATKAVDSLLTKLEKAIPGDWDKPYIEKFKAEYKEELIKLLAE